MKVAHKHPLLSHVAFHNASCPIINLTSEMKPPLVSNETIGSPLCKNILLQNASPMAHDSHMIILLCRYVIAGQFPGWDIQCNLSIVATISFSLYRGVSLSQGLFFFNRTKVSGHNSKGGHSSEVAIRRGFTVVLKLFLPKGSPPISPSRSTLGCAGPNGVVGVATAMVGVVAAAGAVQVLMMGWAAVGGAIEEAWGLEVACRKERNHIIYMQHSPT